MIILYTDTILETILNSDLIVHLWLNDKHIGEIYCINDKFHCLNNKGITKSFDNIKECLSYVYSENNCNSDQLEIEITS